MLAEFGMLMHLTVLNKWEMYYNLKTNQQDTYHNVMLPTWKANLWLRQN